MVRFPGASVVAGVLAFFGLVGSLIARGESDPLPPSGITYTNYHIKSVPWSIHVVQIPRTNSLLEFHSVHAGGGALGLRTLSAQVASLDPALGSPLAAVNGDFYRRERAYAGDPRGLQIVDGEMVSAPAGGVSFWVDVFGEPHATNVWSHFQVIWPDGTSVPCGLNEERQPNSVVLYTPSVGLSTHTSGGREFRLEPAPGSPWLPLRVPRNYRGRVSHISAHGNSPVPPGTLVLSVAPELVGDLPRIETEATLTVSTATFPGLRGVGTAIGGGPVLVYNGKAQRNGSLAAGSFEFTSMLERHPRTALGWNSRFYYLVEVDGRQRHLSVGMTLGELAQYMLELGCDQALGLDGGGSATLWYDGQVRNSPCDGHEREIANSLLVVQRLSAPGTTNASFSTR